MPRRELRLAALSRERGRAEARDRVVLLLPSVTCIQSSSENTSDTREGSKRAGKRDGGKQAMSLRAYAQRG